jgi:hypothetical protein
MTVINENGVGIEDVLVNAVDQFGNPVEWVDQDGTYDKEVTGNRYTTGRLTDSNGLVDYYVKSYDIILDPETEQTSGNNYDILKTTYYPITLTFSKSGYRSYSILLDDFNAPVEGVVTLETGVRDYKPGLITGTIEEQTITAKF